MQISTIAALDTEGVINEEEPTFALGGELSEWFFASRFWTNINLRNGTMFDQFEGGEADSSIAQAIAREFEQKLSELGDDDEVKFAYRCTQSGEKLYIRTDSSGLISEIKLLIDFLNNY
jgi:hypothetical protein